MASKNESPRQKMIGMMYLVLTALLALQVSSALIYKFQALNSSLEKTITDTDLENKRKFAVIADRVMKRGNKPQEVAWSNNANQLRSKTKEMIAYIEQLKRELIDETGGYAEDGSFKGAKDETKVETIMIGANKSSGKAYLLKQKLDEYHAFVSRMSKNKIEPLALHAFEDPKLKDNGDQKNKDYAQLNFGQTPMVAALAVLSETEAKIANIENMIMSDYEERIGTDDIPVDRVVPMVKPQSEYVVAGTKYNAEMFLVASSSSLKPKMEMGNIPLKVNDIGVGSLSFVATGGAYRPDGTLKKTWTGKIVGKTAEGSDTTYLVTQEYTVVKPTIQVQSSNVQALYKNCGNQLTISVPALGAAYNPTFKVEGAASIPGNRPGLITLIPTAASVKVGVTNQGNFLGDERFGVKLIPNPTIEVKVNNQRVSPIEGVSASAARTITVRALPEKNFAEALPRDAIYFITEAKVYLARGRRKIKELPIVGQTVNLSSIASEMKPGDRLVVEVNKVRRKNFRNEVEDVTTVPIYYETIVLN